VRESIIITQKTRASVRRTVLIAINTANTIRIALQRNTSYTELYNFNFFTGLEQRTSKRPMVKTRTSHGVRKEQQLGGVGHGARIYPIFNKRDVNKYGRLRRREKEFNEGKNWVEENFHPFSGAIPIWQDRGYPPTTAQGGANHVALP